MRQVHEYVLPERFVAGTVGEPGQRTFYLQVRDGARMTSVALEKAQVALLADRLDQLLDQVLRRSGGATTVPAVAPPELVDPAPLDSPVEEEFRVGALGLGWDGDDQHVIVAAYAATEADLDEEGLDDDETGPDLLRVTLTGAQARAFVARARTVVAAGRPTCPFCDLPLDPTGHVCPRQNGHRRRS